MPLAKSKAKAPRRCAKCGIGLECKRCSSPPHKEYWPKYCAPCLKARRGELARQNINHDKHRKHWTRRCKWCGGEFSVAGLNHAGTRCYCSPECLSAGRSRTAIERDMGKYWRGRHRSAADCEKKSVSAKAAWRDPGKMQKMRHQSRELIEKRIAPRRGRSLTSEHRANISASLTGRKLTKEHREASAKGWLSGPQNLTPEQQAKRNAAISRSRLGCHGYGLSARDRKDHHAAKHWRIRSPRGEHFEFDNLQSWCRANEWRFCDKHPESKLPLWRRAVGGFNDQQATRNPSCSWYGWTLVAKQQREEDVFGTQLI